MTRKFKRTLLMLGAALGLAACATTPIATVSTTEREAIQSRLMADISTLASDEFGGRKPGTRGERLTTGYIVRELQAAGLQSGTNNPGSEWLAEVPLVATQPATSRIVFNRDGKTLEFTSGSESALAFTNRRRTLVEQGEVVYVGKLGEQVPEATIAGRVVIMLGEPGFSPARRGALFTKNPAAILTVVENAEAIAGVRRAFDRERISLVNEDAPRLSGYISREAMAQKLGTDAWETLLASADDDGFEPVRLDFKATVEATSKRRELRSNNVIGKLSGTKPGSGAVLMLGHWDHLGECGAEDAEDRICNGAVDNASGIAVMLELSRRLAAGDPLERDVYVLATSAEESGLLGARAFIENPAIPLDAIVAAFNFDNIAVAPAGSRVGFVGEGETRLDPLVREVVAAAGRQLGEREYANSFLRRQDGWALLQEGVPAVMISGAFSSEIVLGPFLSSNYHRASDEIESIELGGAIDDLLLHEELVRRTANTVIFPADSE